MELIVVGTYGEKLGHVDGKGSGLYVLKYDHEAQALAEFTGLIGQPQLSHLRNPTYLTSYRSSDQAPPILYIVDERNDSAGTVSAASVDLQTGELKALGPSVAAAVDAKGMAGAACCHISVSPGGEHVLAANYVGGSIVAIGRKADGSLDESQVQHVLLPPGGCEATVRFPGPNPGRQEGSHAHMCAFSVGTDATTVLVPDLGSDVVWSIPYDAANRVTPLGTPVATAAGDPNLRGGGPRHVAVTTPVGAPAGSATRPVAYVAYELSSQVAAWPIDPKTGAIASGSPPLSIVNAISGGDQVFLGPAGSGGAVECGGAVEGGGATASSASSKFVEHSGACLVGPSGGRAPSGDKGVCSDQVSSLAAARVAPGGSHVVVSCRVVGGIGAVSAIRLVAETGELDAGGVGLTSSLGRTPRDFAFLRDVTQAKPGHARGGALALVANQDTDEIALLAEGQAPRLLTKGIPTPVCLCMVG